MVEITERQNDEKRLWRALMPTAIIMVALYFPLRMLAGVTYANYENSARFGRLSVEMSGHVFRVMSTILRPIPSWLVHAVAALVLVGAMRLTMKKALALWGTYAVVQALSVLSTMQWKLLGQYPLLFVYPLLSLLLSVTVSLLLFALPRWFKHMANETIRFMICVLVYLVISRIAMFFQALAIAVLTNPAESQSGAFNPSILSRYAMPSVMVFVFMTLVYGLVRLIEWMMTRCKNKLALDISREM